MKKHLECLYENDSDSGHQCDCIDCYVKYIEELEDEVDELKKKFEDSKESLKYAWVVV